MPQFDVCVYVYTFIWLQFGDIFDCLFLYFFLNIVLFYFVTFGGLCIWLYFMRKKLKFGGQGNRKNLEVIGEVKNMMKLYLI